MTLDWGSAADWVSAIGTGGALFVSLFFIVRDQRRAREEARAAQARQVVTWPTLITSQSDGRHDIQGQVSNASPEPIFDLRISIEGDSSVSSTWPDPGLPDLLAPQSSAQFKIFDSAGTRLELSFTDAAGRHWQRKNGELTETAS